MNGVIEFIKGWLGKTDGEYEQINYLLHLCICLVAEGASSLFLGPDVKAQRYQNIFFRLLYTFEII